MAEPDDPVSRELAVSLKWDANGVSLAARSRVVSSIERLVGSLVDLPTAFFEGIAGKRRLRDEIDRRLMIAQANVAERVLNGSAEAGDTLLLGVLKKEARRQANAGAVAIEALEQLKALPPPTEAGGEAQRGEAESLDDDWFNQFTRYAEDATSAELQQLWGRVLAGEVRRPGSFSRQTLRFVAELDRQTAENCQYVADRMVAASVPYGEEWSSGAALEIGIDLQRLGLLEGVSGGTMAMTYSIGPGGYIAFRNGEAGLVAYGPPSEALRVDSILITRLGKEVLSLLKPTDERLGLRQMGRLLGKAPVTLVELGRFTTIQDRGGNFECEEVLWDSTAGTGGA